MVSFSESLIALSEQAMQHALRSVEDGLDLIPFVMRESGEGPSLKRYLADRLEDCVAAARESLATEPAPYRAALAYDGYCTAADGKRVETIFIEAYERGGAGTLTLAQGTKRRGLIKKRREPVGGYLFVRGDKPPLF